MARHYSVGGPYGVYLPFNVALAAVLPATAERNCCGVAPRLMPSELVSA